MFLGGISVSVALTCQITPPTAGNPTEAGMTDKDVDTGLSKYQAEIQKRRDDMAKKEALYKSISDSNTQQAIRGLSDEIHAIYEKMGEMGHYVGHMHHAKDHDNNEHGGDMHGGDMHGGHGLEYDNEHHEGHHDDIEHHGSNQTGGMTTGQ